MSRPEGVPFSSRSISSLHFGPLKADGGLRDRDLYVFCYDMKTGKFTAHVNQALLGTAVKALKEKDGSPLGEKVFNATKSGTISTVSYNFPPKPGTTEPVPKESYVTQVGNQGRCRLLQAVTQRILAGQALRSLARYASATNQTRIIVFSVAQSRRALTIRARYFFARGPGPPMSVSWPRSPQRRTGPCRLGPRPVLATCNAVYF
jgi:hypothetical protein